MIYDIEISDQAEIDLRGIFEYIAFELQTPENVSGQLDRLEACIMDLDHMPKRYRQYELEPWKSRDWRRYHQITDCPKGSDKLSELAKRWVRRQLSLLQNVHRHGFIKVITGADVIIGLNQEKLSK